MTKQQNSGKLSPDQVGHDDLESKPVNEETAEELPGWLGKGLRDLYDEVLLEPVPDDFKKLLEELAKKTSK